MNAAIESRVREISWEDANQQLLVAELARLKNRLGGEGNEDVLSAACASARQVMPAPAAIDHLADSFGLSSFERDVILLCAGVEMDACFAEQCEIAVGDARRAPNFGLALAALYKSHWTALTPVRPLRRWRMVDIDESSGLSRGRMRIDERILHYLTGANYLDVRLRSLIRLAAPPKTIAASHLAVAERLCHATQIQPDFGAPGVWLTGDDELGHFDVAAEVAAALGLTLHVLEARDVPTGHGEIDALATLWERESLLLRSALLVRSDALDPFPAAAIRFVEQLRGLTFLSAHQPQPLDRLILRSVVTKPQPAEQKQLWQQALGPAAQRLNGALDGIAAQFKLSARTIHSEGSSLLPLLAGSDQPEYLLWSSCRGLGRSKLDELAQRIDCVAGWDDLILPGTQVAMLRQIGAQVRNRMKVHVEWGFDEKGSRGMGISALFTGESGTGKTMAAEVLGRELGLDVYRIDLSAVVSKYIGETEKNLRRVFDAAEDSGAILLFDEADALFGKRSEVKDSHDRYANIEVSYLLQRMESYRGLAVLTSNLKNALDNAFQRRLRFVVHFPFPEQAQREMIWRRTLPERAPTTAIDFGKLARLGVAGGNIRNIAIDAAFRAAELGEPVSMTHLLSAARYDASKRDRPLSDAETRGWE